MSKVAKSGRPLHILVIYCAYTTRSNLIDSLYSFRRYTEHYIYYFNVAFFQLPSFLTTLHWDRIIFHTLFFSRKFERDRQSAVFKKVMSLSSNPATKILTPQDEFINGDITNKFAKEIRATVICSVQPPAVWPEIYGELSGVTFRSVLTGYIDPARAERYKKFLSESHERTVDVGYRTVGKPVPWFGRHGYLKEEIARKFSGVLVGSGLAHDIATGDEHVLAGDSWYMFLGNCKYILGVEGGTSIYDRNGVIKSRVDEFLKCNPTASFELTESKCFYGLDGKFKGFAISPRHLEACMIGTCQVLTEGEYSGILIPYKHYIPVAKDFSNLNEVIEILKSDHLRKSIVSNAYLDIVESGYYSFEQYPRVVIGPVDEFRRSHTLQGLSLIVMHATYWALYALEKANYFAAMIRELCRGWKTQARSKKNTNDGI